MAIATFTLEQDVFDLLNSFKCKYKIPKSVIINTILKRYVGRAENLFTLIIGDDNGDNKE